MTYNELRILDGLLAAEEDLENFEKDFLQRLNRQYRGVHGILSPWQRHNLRELAKKMGVSA